MKEMDGKFYHTIESVEQYIKIAEGYDGKELIDKLQNFLPKKSSVLELGSGPGKDLKILEDIYDVTGSDYSSIFIELLKKNNSNIGILHLNAVTLETENHFDAIYSNKVLQHLTDDELKESFQNQFDKLNDNGIICHSFWEGTICEEMHGSLQNYHTIKEIEQLFFHLFDILHLELYNEMAKNDSILLIGRKK